MIRTKNKFISKTRLSFIPFALLAFFSLPTHATSPSSPAKNINLCERIGKGYDKTDNYAISIEYNNGLMHYLGAGAKQDYPKALEWFRKATKKTYDEDSLYSKEPFIAQYIIGCMYKTGKGVKANPKEAFKWFNKSARALPDAKFELAQMYYLGNGTKQDRKKAFDWFSKIVDEEEIYPDRLFFTLLEIEPSLPYEVYVQLNNTDVEDINRDQISFNILKKLANKGNLEAQYALAENYAFNDTLELTEEERQEGTNKWLFKAAEQGHTKAQLHLSYKYRYGYELEQSSTKAIKWLKKAAHLGDVTAQEYLGLEYYKGLIAEKDDKKALYWFVEASYQNSEKAKYIVGYMHQYGEGVERNNQRAAKWYTRAARQNYTPTSYQLGKIYYRGEGIEQNYDEAIKWFAKTVENHTSLGFVILAGKPQDEQEEPEEVSQETTETPETTIEEVSEEAECAL